ncbi:MAG TPA: hypothetical protein VHR66_29210 [Gemmataceae bacterium]|jgi:hypothetical protein|nr:hypothetical protein [Gemmataceae bacterium]
MTERAKNDWPYVLGLSVVGVIIAWSGGCFTKNSASEADQKAALERQAIARVFAADKSLHRQLEQLPDNAKTSELVGAIRRYCDSLDRLDMTNCPVEFQVAYKHHIAAWRKFEGAVRQLPDGFFSGAIQGTVNLVTKGEWDGGVGRMQAEVQACQDNLKASWQDVERIAAQHGVATAK